MNQLSLRSLEIIHENPFRILGLPVTATDRDIAKRVNDLATYAEFGKSRDYNTDLPFLSPLKRTSESIDRAAQRLELPDRKLHFANFWFWQSNSVDELVIEVIGAGDGARALTLLARAIAGKPLVAKTLSNYRNCALLAYILGNQNDLSELNVGVKSLQQFIRQSVNVLSNPAYPEFAARVVGKTYSVDPTREVIRFAEELSRIVRSDQQADLETTKLFLFSFSDAASDVQRHVKMIFTTEPMRRIEEFLEEAALTRVVEPGESYELGLRLADRCGREIEKLTSLLTNEDPHVQGLRDKVAEELIDCSTAYFNEVHEDDEADAIESARILTKKAETFAIGLRARTRVREDLEQIRGFETRHALNAEANRIMAEIGGLPRLDSVALSNKDLLGLVVSLINKTAAPLSKLRSSGGEGKELYDYFGKLVAQVAVAMCVKYANTTNDFKSVVPLMARIAPLPMDPEQRRQFNTNKNVLDRNFQQAQDQTKNSAWRGSNGGRTRVQPQGQASGGGCFIATLVYGSEERSQVIALKRFRDEVLLHSWAGRCFVSLYYAVSPTLVVWLRPYPAVHIGIRKMLDRLVRSVE